MPTASTATSSRASTSQDGKRKWKGGRYGNGQLLLLPDQDLLLVLSEEGELALVKADARSVHRGRARSGGARGQDLEPPGAGRRRLLVRNGEEMAAFRRRLAGRGDAVH